MKMRWLILATAVLALSQYAHADQLGTYAFPQKGQTPDQQNNDEGYCAQWAQGQTGLNAAALQQQQSQAMQAQQQMAAQQPSAGSKAVRRIGRAALTGAALGGIDNSMGDGAGKGAVMGVAYGTSQAVAGAREQKAQDAVNAVNAQAQKVQADTEKYLRAYCACMEGKGYSIR